ncbi:ATP-dependent nuclease [Bradyrhizobium elkanii]
MQLIKFRVQNYRNIWDSGTIDISKVTAFVGQNEAGKSNLFEALYCINPITPETYKPDEDWPVDRWEGRATAKGKEVCWAEFALTEDEIKDIFIFAAPEAPPPAATPEGSPPLTAPALAAAPKTATVIASRAYGYKTAYSMRAEGAQKLDHAKVSQWIAEKLPKFVLVREYEMSGEQVELDQLRQRLANAGNNRQSLSNDDQTILIILDLAAIDLDDFIKKGQTTDGRTVRSFDKRSASSYLTRQFQKLWTQKNVRFDIDVDGSTLNIFAEDHEIGMPVRLKRRSTGFRWYVSFAWKFTHATRGDFKDCILLLEEPGIHLHYSGQKDLLDTFENLSNDNTILYTTHLASMVDLANPERVRIVESHNHHLGITQGVVSSSRGPMAVIERSLGLTGDLSGMLGNRQVLIVEGGTDALILQKLSGLLSKEGKGLSDHVFPWPAQTASKTPMYAAFAIGQKWDAGVLLDTDPEGNTARDKIKTQYLNKLAEEQRNRFRVFMLGKAAGIKKTDAGIEDIFPDEFYLECTNAAFGVAIKLSDLPLDGSDMITKRVEHVLKTRHHHKALDKERVFAQMLRKFDQWKRVDDLPGDTAARAAELFATINRTFAGGST